MSIDEMTRDELRAEVERLRQSNREAFGRTFFANQRAESAEAERDALQQRLDNVRALADRWSVGADSTLRGMAAKVARDHAYEVRLVLDGPAAPTQEPQPRCNCEDPPVARLVACPVHGLPQELRPTPEEAPCDCPSCLDPEAAAEEYPGDETGYAVDAARQQDEEAQA